MIIKPWSTCFSTTVRTVLVLFHSLRMHILHSLFCLDNRLKWEIILSRNESDGIRMKFSYWLNLLIFCQGEKIRNNKWVQCKIIRIAVDWYKVDFWSKVLFWNYKDQFRLFKCKVVYKETTQLLWNPLLFTIAYQPLLTLNKPTVC